MRKTEQRLWDRMRKHAQAHPKVRLERVENLVGVGIPDVLLISRGQVAWCELKAVPLLPARKGTRVLGAKGLSVAQRNWHYDWYAHGGMSIILIGIGAEQLFAIPGFLADAVNEMSMAELQKNSITSTWDDFFFQWTEAA
jgi:hypothetical protein